MTVLPVSAVIATRHRARSLERTLASLESQSSSLREIIVIDASDDSDTRTVCKSYEHCGKKEGSEIRYSLAVGKGAAVQRNEGALHATQPFMLFLDDDVILQPDCVTNLWSAISEDAGIGGVSATISNQGFNPPARLSRALYWLLDDRPHNNRPYAGRVLGPAINLLPQDRDDLPEVVRVEWLNTTCTLYRWEALSTPPFSPHFTGYSLMEDLALSLEVSQRGWTLANARLARVFHDSQPGDHKNNHAEVAKMELVNRHYIMTKVLKKYEIKDFFRLALFEIYNVANALRRGHFLRVTRGKMSAVWTLWRNRGDRS